MTYNPYLTVSNILDLYIYIHTCFFNSIDPHVSLTFKRLQFAQPVTRAQEPGDNVRTACVNSADGLTVERLGRSNEWYRSLFIYIYETVIPHIFMVIWYI